MLLMLRMLWWHDRWCLWFRSLFCELFPQQGSCVLRCAELSQCGRCQDAVVPVGQPRGIDQRHPVPRQELQREVLVQQQPVRDNGQRRVAVCLVQEHQLLVHNCLHGAVVEICAAASNVLLLSCLEVGQMLLIEGLYERHRTSCRAAAVIQLLLLLLLLAGRDGRGSTEKLLVMSMALPRSARHGRRLGRREKMNAAVFRRLLEEVAIPAVGGDDGRLCQIYKSRRQRDGGADGLVVVLLMHIGVHNIARRSRQG